jgi:hypothetical protein
MRLTGDWHAAEDAAIQAPAVGDPVPRPSSRLGALSGACPTEPLRQSPSVDARPTAAQATSATAGPDATAHRLPTG